VKEYYDTRAPEYDEWYRRLGRFDGFERPHWDDELVALEVTGLDQSERMLAIARERMPAGHFVRGDALELPFPEDSFDRVFTGHFYGHLHGPQREEFLAEARRVAPQLVVVDTARRPDRQPVEHRQRRVLNSGRRFEVYKRYFTAAQLADELGGGSVLHEGRWFVMVTSP
jgi:SAM-dependent methyltransferase